MFNKEELLTYLKTLIEDDEVTNTLMLALKHKYYSVYTHCLNVGVISYLLCYKMNLTVGDSISTALGGLFHDISKLIIPSKILYKYGSLTSKERNIIRSHPINGINILSNSKYLTKLNDSILYHHERYDGTGYPSKLKGKDIPLQARIVAICNCFDNMLSCHGYKDVLTVEEAKNELIKNKDSQFDGEIVDEFLEIIDNIYNEYYNSEDVLYIKEDISEQEKMLRALEKDVEYLNIITQSNILLSSLYNLKQISKKVLNIFDKIIRIDYMNIFIKTYMDINFYNVDSMEGFTQDVKEYIYNNIEEIFNIKEMRLLLKRINNRLLITLVSPLEDKNVSVIFIQTNIETEISEREKKLLQTVLNNVNNAIQKYLFFVEIKEKTIRDSLTGLYNRQHLLTIIDSLDLNFNLIGIIIADINNLKYINDAFGNLYGDLVIKTTAQILKKSVKEGDYVFRYEGDKFMILAINCNKNYIRTVIRRIHINTAHLWNKKQKNVELTMNIGYSICSKNIFINETISIAEENMYIEKNKSKSIPNYPQSIFLSK